MELFIIAIAYLFGIILGLYFKIGIVFIVVICSILYTFRKKNKYIKLFCTEKCIILFLLFFLLSFLKINYLEYHFNEKYKMLQGEIQVIGTITSDSEQKQNTTSYTLKVEKINEDSSFKNTNLRLYIKNEKVYKYGDQISFIAEFKEPEVQRNTGGFDYKQYLKTKRIYGIVTTNANKVELKKENNINIVSLLVKKIENKIKEKANTLLPEKEANTLLGILIGDKENLEEDLQESFRKSNLSHMLAVSGAHVSYIIIAIAFIINKSKVSKNKGKIITIALLMFFMILTRADFISYKGVHHVDLYDSSKSSPQKSYNSFKY